MVPRRKYVWWVVLAALGVGACIAQFPPMGQRPPRQPRAGEYGPFPPEPPPYVDEGGSLVRGEGGILIDETTVKTAREVASHSTGTPEWKNPPGFEKDVFTFARILFRSTGNPGVNAQGWGRGRHLNWWVDFPDADLNFSYRTQQLTSIRTDPDGRVLRLSDPQLTHFPMIIMEHPGYIGLNETGRWQAALSVGVAPPNHRHAN
jgi:hypothetical protein